MRHVRIAISSAAIAAVAVAGLVAVPLAQAQQGASGSIYNKLSEDPRFTTTMQMVYVTGAANRLMTAGDMTVFAATDAGWQTTNYGGKLSSLSSTGASSAFPDSMGILEVIRGFFVSGREPPASRSEDVRFESRAGRPIELDKKTMEVKWVDPEGQTKTAKVSGPPIHATNGVIYPVDAVVGE